MIKETLENAIKQTIEKKIPHKVLCYFSLDPRLKCLFATSKTVKLMWWHCVGKSKDNDVMRDSIDGKA